MKKILLILLTLAWVVPGWAFTVLSEEGVEMEFQILDEDEKTCMTAVGFDSYEPGCIALLTRGKITIPEVANGYTVVGIGFRSFITCSLITEVVIPETVLWIDEDAFMDCFSLNKVNDISHVMTIDEGAFANTSLREVAIGSDDPWVDVEIGGRAFSGCTGLKKLTLGDNVTRIGEHAFSGCSALEAVHIPASVEFIGSCAFRGLTACESITVDAANRKYEDKGCNALFEKGKGTVLTGCMNTNLNHPEITGIGVDAFRDIPITDLYIPANIQTIHANPFLRCPLERITVAEDNPCYDSRDDCNAIICTANNTLQTGCRNTIIPSSVEVIGYQSFHQVYGITEALIPEGVKVIEDYAFYWCYDLQKVVIPSTVTQIGESFQGNLDLADVYSYIKEPFYIDEHTFVKTASQLPGMFGSGGIDDIVLHVPKGTKVLYQQMLWWNLFLNIEEMDDNSEVTAMATDKAVTSVKYHNLAGMVSDRPFDGVNIVTTTYTDGTTTTAKVLR